MAHPALKFENLGNVTPFKSAAVQDDQPFEPLFATPSNDDNGAQSFLPLSAGSLIVKKAAVDSKKAHEPSGQDDGVERKSTLPAGSLEEELAALEDVRKNQPLPNAAPTDADFLPTDGGDFLDSVINELSTPFQESLVNTPLYRGDKVEEPNEEQTNEVVERYEAMIAELKASHEKELVELREQHNREIGEKITQGLSEMEERLSDELTGQAARVLEPMVRENIREKCLADFREELRKIMHTRKAVQVEVRGPRDMIQNLRLQLSLDQTRLTYQENDDFVLTANFDGQTMATRLNDWVEKVKGAIES